MTNPDIDYTELVARLRNEEPLPWRYVEAAADAIEGFVAALAAEMEWHEKCMIDRDFWKARAEKAEADVAFLAEQVEKHVALGVKLGERAEKAEDTLRDLRRHLIGTGGYEEGSLEIDAIDAALKEQGQ